MEDIQEIFGNYLYLPNSVKDTFNNIEAKSVHISEKDVRGLYITLGTDTEAEITIKLIVSPIISFFNDSQEVELTAGYAEKYVAEFIINDVSYPMISENLTQEEFIQILLSMPIFQ